MAQRHAVVVGGGIGGLSAAIGLHRVGWRVTVLERAPEFAEIGAGITLWPNALRALDTLGLGREFEPLLAAGQVSGLRDKRGRWLTRWDGTQFQRKLGKPMVAIHRASLVELLQAALPTQAMHAGTEVVDVTPAGHVRSTNGDLDADMVVGADGIDSRLRTALWPTHPGPSYTGSTGFRAVLDHPVTREFGTAWGSGTEFGMVPLADDRLYWFAALNSTLDTAHPNPKAFLLSLFESWFAPVRELIGRTAEHRITQHDLYQLSTPLDSYVCGRVALLGDAAHAMAPFLGQGGCQAIEDAVQLAAATSRFVDVPAALTHYDWQRRPRSQRIAGMSMRMGRIGAQLTHPIAVTARNTVIRLIPDGLSVRGTMAIADWTPPTIESPRQQA